MCIFGCEIGQINNVDQCHVECGADNQCLNSCLLTVECIAGGCNDVTGQLAINRGVIVYNRAAQVWQQTVVIMNLGCDRMTNLGYFLDSLSAGWGLTNGDGATAATGIVFKKVGSLDPMSATTITLQFSRTGISAFAYTPRVVNGIY